MAGSAALTVLLAIAGQVPPARASSISTKQSQVGADRAQASVLQQQVTQAGAAVQKLVVRYDQVLTQDAAINAQISVAQARLAADRRASAAAVGRLRHFALEDYMSGAGTAALAIWLSGSSMSSLAVDQEYTDLATRNIAAAIDAVQLDQKRTRAAESELRIQQEHARATASLLVTERAAAEAAVTEDNARLAQLHGNMTALMASIATQLQAQQAATEQALAAKQAAAASTTGQATSSGSPPSASPAAPPAGPPAGPTSTSPPAPVPAPAPVHPSPGSYTDPLASVQGLAPERIDQGVDYSGYGTVVALGAGTVLSIENSGWPGGTFIAYRLADGPAAGLVVYVAEDLLPEVSVGQSVTAGTPLGTMYEGPDGIETGWADPSGDGMTMARVAGQFSGANSTAYGANFSQFLASLGASPGVLQNDPPTGQLAPNWPSW